MTDIKLGKLGGDMSRAIEDIEKFTEGGGSPDNFIYRYGFFGGAGEREGRLIGLFHANSEEKLERRIARLDKVFHVYTDTLADREYDKQQKLWYCTYVVLYPFDKEVMSGKFDGQNCKPLF